MASVAGRRVDHDCWPPPPGSTSRRSTRRCARPSSRQLLFADPTGGYTFRHALLQEAIYGDLLPGERTRLHAVYVELLSREGQRWGCGSAADLAYHSLASHDLAAALKALDRAAAEAQSLGAPFEALRHLEQALALWDRVPDRRGARRPAALAAGPAGCGCRL